MVKFCVPLTRSGSMYSFLFVRFLKNQRKMLTPEALFLSPCIPRNVDFEDMAPQMCSPFKKMLRQQERHNGMKSKDHKNPLRRGLINVLCKLHFVSRYVGFVLHVAPIMGENYSKGLRICNFLKRNAELLTGLRWGLGGWYSIHWRKEMTR